MPDGKEQVSGNGFYNINPKSFDWWWGVSTDNGATWETNWLRYIVGLCIRATGLFSLVLV